MAEAFDTQYVEGVRELMAAYNKSADETLYQALYELCYAPNEAALRENYAKNAETYASAYDSPVLPAYDELPVLLFPVTNAYSVLFEQKMRGFLLDGADGVLALLQTLIFSDEAALPHAAERFRQDLHDVRGRELEQELRAAIRAQDFGTNVQETAEEYRALCPHGELYEAFRAEEALARGDAERAVAFGEQAYAKRKMSRLVHELLYRVYMQAGRPDCALLFLILAKGPESVIFPSDAQERERCLNIIRLALTDAQLAPLITDAYLTESAVKTRLFVRLGEELLRFSEDLPRYWAGVYNPYGLMYVKSHVAELMNGAMEQHNFSIFNDFVFDIMKAHEALEYAAAPEKSAAVLIPIAAKKSHQMMHVRNAKIDRMRMLSEGEFNFFRIEEPTTFQSEDPLIVGAPVLLRHGAHRKKVVLNILADGLSWKEIQEADCKFVPNIMKFFSQGVIFDNSFSTAEYTYPALATIETGLYQHHTQIAKPGVPFALDPSYVTLSEQMKELGYYCTNIQSCGTGIYNGTSRGYDRLIVNHWMMPAADGVERTIRHLETFDECDNFLFMHFADTHPYNADVSTPAYASAHLPLADVLQPQDRESSVFLKPNPLSRHVNRSEIAAVDRQLGYLFDYLAAHYEDDEYIVLLYSDHGTSVHARSPYLLSEEQTGTALMARGAGVPALGRVDELTSSVDIYKILGKLAGYPIDAAYLDGSLPEAFGGQRREYTVSNSIYPGQTYKICVRTERHAFHLETEEFTREDGTVSFERCKYHIHERNEDYREIFDDALARYFLDIVWKYTESFRG